MVYFIGFLLFMVSSILSSIYGGFVLSVLWGWFVSPVFGLPVITFLQGIGLSIVTHFLTVQYVKQEFESPSEAMLNALIFSLTYSTMALASGWVLHLFM